MIETNLPAFVSEHRATAIHEAGHAVVVFLLNGADAIKYVSTMPNDSSRGIVKLDNDRLQNKSATSWMLLLLAGPAASFIHAQQYGGDDDYEIDQKEYWEFDYPCGDTLDNCAGCDYHSAVRIGEQKFFPPQHNAQVYANRIAGAAKNLLEIPRVWGMVLALADALPNNTLLSGYDATQIMFKAWGSSRVSLHQLGSKWSRRFPSIGLRITRKMKASNGGAT